MPLGNGRRFLLSDAILSLTSNVRQSDEWSCMMTTNEINILAYEQAILAKENEIDMDAELALQLNIRSLPTESNRRQFKHDFRRHMKNIAEGNPFYD